MSSSVERYLERLPSRDFDVDGETVICWFGRKNESRHHAVRVREASDGIRLEATVATARTVELMALHRDPHLWAWRRNRASHLVGFRVDGRRRLIAETLAPLIGLSQDEFVVYLMAVASEADRMELVLTADDVQ